MAHVASPFGEDEEILDMLLGEDRERGAAGVVVDPPRRGLGHRAAGTALVFAGLAAVAGLVWSRGGTYARPRAGVQLAQFESKAQLRMEWETPKVVHDSAAREEARRKLDIEVDLRALVTPEALDMGATGRDWPGGAADCSQRAAAIFDRVVSWAGLDEELQKDESQAWKARFVEALQPCRPNQQDAEWFKRAGQAFEDQKPVMTKALAESLNTAGFGFSVHMKEWMVHESKESFQFRLGRASELPEDAKVTTPAELGPLRSSTSDPLPETFDSSEKWPHCKQEIMRIHNQGHCGSCWSFSCSQVLDARLCIQSYHLFDGSDAKLAPGYFASCAADVGFPGNGCSGGWEYYCYEFMDRNGTYGGVSESCSPYFATGAGEQHFHRSRRAPECPETCQDGYPRSLEEEGFKLPGVSQYLLVISPDEAGHVLARQVIYNGGSINYGIYVHHPFYGYRRGVYDLCSSHGPNHAVVAYGYFPGGYYSKNSWGSRWGDGGLFMIADCVLTDFTAPGNYDAMHSHIPYPLAHAETLHVRE